MVFLNPNKISVFGQINPFHATGVILYLLKASEGQKIFEVFWGYGKRPVA